MSANKELAAIFWNMSAIYQYMGGAERFRALAYRRVSNMLANLQTDITEYVKNDTVENLPGVGEGIGDKIREFLKKGKIKKYEELKKKVPFELLGLMEITGFGPQSLKKIHEELGVSTKDELIKALSNGEVSELSGFGKKKVENMLRGLKMHKTIEERMLLWDAIQLGNKVTESLKNFEEVKEIKLAGSLRRRKETIGDIDILIACDKKDRKKIVSKFVNLPFIREVLAKGETKASVIIEDFNRQVDLRIVDMDEWGSALLYFTGSKEHNIRLRTIARDRGYKISEYGLFELKKNKHVAGRTEEEIYHALGFQWMPPEMREDGGELDLAAKKEIPRLVNFDDIKGDLQMHSTWSDGEMDIEELARFVLKNYKYDYIVLTDHSQSVRVAGGMNEKEFLQQIDAIKEVNKKLGKTFIKAGTEVDIKTDGTLDLENNVLEKLDWVCASIHSGLNQDNTERLIAACHHPLVCCIGHPSGRLIGKREPYKVDWKKVFKAASQTGTAMEINCQPERMDLNDELAMQARKQGVKLVISTDSHQKHNFGFMLLGVSIARRAWCTNEDILNTKDWNELEKFKQNKRKELLVSS